MQVSPFSAVGQHFLLFFIGEWVHTCRGTSDSRNRQQFSFELQASRSGEGVVQVEGCPGPGQYVALPVIPGSPGRKLCRRPTEPCP